MFLALEKTHLREIYFPPTFCSKMLDNKVHSKIHLKNPSKPVKIIFLYLELGTNKKMECF